MSEHLPPPDMTAAALKAAGELARLAADSPVGGATLTNLGEPLVIVSRTVRNWFLPLALHNVKREQYFQQKFEEQLGPRIEQIPEEQRVAPKPSIAGPAIEGLGYAHEEERLRDLYLNLLASSADKRRVERVHPSFAVIISQLTSDEANYLQSILDYPKFKPIVRLTRTAEGEMGHTIVRNHVMDLRDGGSILAEPRLPAYIDNFQRLGLVSVDYARHLTADGLYAWVESRPEIAEVKQGLADRYVIEWDRGQIAVTALGEDFAAVVGPAARPATTSL